MGVCEPCIPEKSMVQSGCMGQLVVKMCYQHASLVCTQDTQAQTTTAQEQEQEHHGLTPTQPGSQGTAPITSAPQLVFDVHAAAGGAQQAATPELAAGEVESLKCDKPMSVGTEANKLFPIFRPKSQRKVRKTIASRICKCIPDVFAVSLLPWQLLHTSASCNISGKCAS